MSKIPAAARQPPATVTGMPPLRRERRRLELHHTFGSGGIGAAVHPGEVRLAVVGLDRADGGEHRPGQAGRRGRRTRRRLRARPRPAPTGVGWTQKRYCRSISPRSDGPFEAVGTHGPIRSKCWRSACDVTVRGGAPAVPRRSETSVTRCHDADRGAIGHRVIADGPRHAVMTTGSDRVPSPVTPLQRAADVREWLGHRFPGQGIPGLKGVGAHGRGYSGESV
jgi:hypothetical protein